MTRPAALPALASPPGDRVQISVTSGFALSAAERRSGKPGSTRPSASITFMPARFSTVSFIVGLFDQSGLSGQVGLTGSIPVAPVKPPSANAARPRRATLCRQGIARLARPLAHPFGDARFFAIDDDEVVEDRKSTRLNSSH